MMTEDSKKIDEMYSIRSNIRALYLNNDTSQYESNLISRLIDYYPNIIKDVEADYKLFTINISLDSSATAKDRSNIIKVVNEHISTFILDRATNKEIIDYVYNNNQYTDSFYVGDIIKFIL